MNRLMKNISLGLVLSLPFTANAGSVNEEIAKLQQQWAHVNYELKDDAQQQGFEKLVQQAQAVTEQYTGNAESWIWSGIIQSSFAGKKGGLGALSLAKKSKKDFEIAIELDANALNGSALMSLGVLFHKVPGWPIGFGDDDKAEELMKKALAINPKGIDGNYFYGEYLYDEGKYQQAKDYLNLALQAAPRPNRPLADKYRQEEIRQVLAKVEKRLNKGSKK
ncbi:hypothetical protein SG34_012815 [Thalassomonas viridans]|uniref:Tetratricopeptide repeat protein n=1 Tax=Thalassomonas viridans TaxID=137584 RepID=A0AAF0C9N0_9GAMM|nr:hypothetical protein [Thalassomonas viridans]WDE07692.1 hypothetical protein SG34_012815 [Thalassomonas viridans]